MSTNNKGFVDDFLDGVKEGYDAEDKRIKAEETDLLTQVKDGATSGAVNSLLNPFTWLQIFFK